MRPLLVALLLLLAPLAEAATTIDGPVCGHDFGDWDQTQVCVTVFYNSVIEEGRVVVCGYDQATETLYTMYAGQDTATECHDEYAYGSNFGFDLFYDSGTGGSSTVFDGGTDGQCNCSCPMPNDLVGDVGGTTGQWAEKSFPSVIESAVYAGLPGFTNSTDYDPFLFGIAGTSGSDKVWQANGNVPAINFGGGSSGDDVFNATWPVVGSMAWPSVFGSTSFNDTMILTWQNLDAFRVVAWTSRFIVDEGPGNDLFYNGLTSSYAPDAHNPFLAAGTFLGNAASTMSNAAPNTADLAMSNAAEILGEETTGNCTSFSSCVQSPHACPAWIENTPGNPTHLFPGMQTQNDGV